jgi:hypothetical protein
MVKFTHLLVLSVFIVWLAGSGCVGDSTLKVKDSGVNPDVAGMQNGAPTEDLEIGLTQTGMQELDSEMTNIEELLNNANTEEEIEIEEM